MSAKRIAIAGAGMMALARGRAFLDTGRAEICAVAARHAETAQRCAGELGCSTYTDDYRRLAESQPDAILIEVPHKPQDEIALWALEAGYDLLIGGSLASCVDKGRRILELAKRGERIVEAGYNGRYDPAWEETRRLIQDKVLGEPVMAVGMALWKAKPGTWYYDQEASGGMPVTHMSYQHLNAIRWILGKPIVVTALANRKAETSPGRVVEETVGALVGFEDGSIASATASFIKPEGMVDPEPRFLCSEGGIQINSAVSLTLFHQGSSEVRSFEQQPPSFVRQANAFLDAIETRLEARNPPDDALIDLLIAEAISRSVRERRTISLAG